MSGLYTRSEKIEVGEILSTLSGAPLRSRRVSTIFLPGWVGGREKSREARRPPAPPPSPPRNAAVAEAAGAGLPQILGVCLRSTFPARAPTCSRTAGAAATPASDPVKSSLPERVRELKGRKPGSIATSRNIESPELEYSVLQLRVMKPFSGRAGRNPVLDLGGGVGRRGVVRQESTPPRSGKELSSDPRPA